MKRKVTCTLDFFTCELVSRSSGQTQKKSIYDHFLEFQSKIIELTGVQYEMRNLQKTADGFKGILGKLRDGALPVIAEPKKKERAIPLKEKERILEKMHFQFYYENSIMIIQRNNNVGRTSILESFFTHHEYYFKLFPIVTSDSLTALFQDTVHVKSFDVRIARPLNTDLFKLENAGWGDDIIDLLSNEGASSINISVRADGRTSNPVTKYLGSGIKEKLKMLTQHYDVQKAKVKVDSDGNTYPIDLIADRIFYTETIELDKHIRSIPSENLWYTIDRAKKARHSDLNYYFGSLEDNNRLC